MNVAVLVDTGVLRSSRSLPQVLPWCRCQGSTSCEHISTHCAHQRRGGPADQLPSSCIGSSLGQHARRPVEPKTPYMQALMRRLTYRRAPGTRLVHAQGGAGGSSAPATACGGAVAPSSSLSSMGSTPATLPPTLAGAATAPAACASAGASAALCSSSACRNMKPGHSRVPSNWQGLWQRQPSGASMRLGRRRSRDVLLRHLGLADVALAQRVIRGA